MSTAVADNRITNNGMLATLPPAKLVSHDNSPIAYVMDTAKFEHTQRIAKTMALAAFMPKHLTSGTPERAVANCMMVLSQAMRWNMDPFSVAPETYEVQGKMSYQGKLVAAVVNARAGLHRSLDAIYSNGKGDNLAAVIYGSREAIPMEAKPLLKKYVNDEDRDALTDLKFMGVMAIRVSVGQCKTNNKMWTTDPEQKLFYTGATKWARRFAPELMMGVITDEDIDRMSHSGNMDTPPGTSPRTLDDLNKAVEDVATVKLPEPAPEVKPEPQGEVIDSVATPTEGKPIHPEWSNTLYQKISMANRVSLLEPIGNELINDMKNPDVSEADKAQEYPGLFKAWVMRNAEVAKAAEKPLVKHKVEAWVSVLPAGLHRDLVQLLN